MKMLLLQVLSNRLLAGVAWISVEKIFRLLVGFFLFAYVAREIGAGNFGEFSLALAVYGILFAIIPMGSVRQSIRELTLNESEQAQLYTMYLLMRLISATLISLVSLVIFFLVGIEQMYLWVLVASVLSFSEFHDAYSQAKQSVKFITIARFWGFALTALARLTIVVNDMHLAWLFASIVIEPLVLCIAVLWQASKEYLLRFNFSASEIWNFSKERTKTNWPEALSAVFTIIYMKLDLFFVKAFLDAPSVGTYSVAVRLTEIWYFIPVAIVNLTFPGVVRALRNDRSQFETRMIELTSLLFWIGVAYYVFIVIVAVWLIPAVFGSEYVDAIGVLQILAAAGVFVGIGLASGSWLHAEGKLKYAMGRTFLALVANFILGIMLIPKFGLSGAAWATVISMSIAFFISDLFLPGGRDIFRIKLASMNPMYAIRGLKTIVSRRVH